MHSWTTTEVTRSGVFLRSYFSRIGAVKYCNAYHRGKRYCPWERCSCFRWGKGKVCSSNIYKRKKEWINQSIIHTKKFVVGICLQILSLRSCSSTDRWIMFMLLNINRPVHWRLNKGLCPTNVLTQSVLKNSFSERFVQVFTVAKFPKQSVSTSFVECCFVLTN